MTGITPVMPVDASGALQQRVVVQDLRIPGSGALDFPAERARGVASNALDHLARMLGRDVVAGDGRPLTVVLDDPWTTREAFADPATNSVHFTAKGRLASAAIDPDAVMHEVTHIATERLIPDRLPRTRQLMGTIGQDLAVREALSDVAGALHGRTWQLGTETHQVRDLARDPGIFGNPRVRAMQAWAGAGFFSVHDAGSPITREFHRARDVGWEALEQAFGATVNALARTPDAPLTYRGTLDVLKGALRAVGHVR